MEILLFPAAFIPIQNLEQILALVTEDKIAAIKGISMHFIPNESGKSVYRFTHIRVSCSQIDGCIFINP